MYAATNKLLPSKLSTLYQQNTEIHNHQTRQANNPHIRYRKTIKAGTSINHKGPEIWHNLSNELKKSTNIKTFTNQYKCSILHLYKNN